MYVSTMPNMSTLAILIRQGKSSQNGLSGSPERISRNSLDWPFSWRCYPDPPILAFFVFLAFLENLTSLNKEVRPFFLSDNSIWSFPSVSSLSDYSIWRSSLAITSFEAFQFIDPKYFYRLGKTEFKESSLLI